MQLELVILETPWFKEGLLYLFTVYPGMHRRAWDTAGTQCCSPSLRFAMSPSHIHIPTRLNLFVHSFVQQLFLSAECCLGLSVTQSPGLTDFLVLNVRYFQIKELKTGCKEILKLKRKLICHRY